MLLAIFFGAGAASLAVHAVDAPEAQVADHTLPRLLATLDAEPLAFIAIRDVRALPEKYSATTLAKMIADPSYDKGALLLESKLLEIIGVNVRADWPALEKNFSGPLVLALLPAKAPAAEVVPVTPNGALTVPPAPNVNSTADATAIGAGPMRLVFLALVAAPDVAGVLQAQWPKPLNPGTLIAAAPLKTAVAADLPPFEKLPQWAAALDLPAGDIVIRAQPLKLCDAARPFIKQNLPPVENLPSECAPLFAAMEGSATDALAWGLSFKGELLAERLNVDVNENDSAFKRIMLTIKEKPGAWESLLAATPGEQDAAVLLQSDPNALGNDLPFAFQAIERFLRGKRWSRADGMKAEAFDIKRFKFLFERMQGMFGIVARPAITGDLRMVVASSVKGLDVEAYRAEMIAGLENVGAGFETYANTRKIGGVSPLGATFQGRGRFAAPVIGLSPGWTWLCSSSTAYLSLTEGLKNGRMMSDAGKKSTAPAQKDPAKMSVNERAKIAALERLQVDPNVGQPEVRDLAAAVRSLSYWSAADAWRVEVNFEKVFKIGYAAWLLSSTEGPSIGAWKIPNDLVPSPQVFSRHLGSLQAAARRQDRRVEFRSQCAFPGVTPGVLAALQEAAETVVLARKTAKETQAAFEARDAAEKKLEEDKIAEKERKKNSAKEKEKEKNKPKPAAKTPTPTPTPPPPPAEESAPVNPSAPNPAAKPPAEVK